MTRPIFVVGCPRSGTTLLGLMLHAHPRIAIPPETRFLLQLYNERSDFGDPSQRATRMKIADYVVERRKSRFADLGIDADVVRKEIVEGQPTLASAASAAFRVYADEHGKARWGDKRPAYYGFLPELRSLFPDAQFVSIVRDGRDVVASLKGQQWFHRDVQTAVSMWTMAIDSGREASRTFPGDAYYEVRYESLAEEPESELRRLCDFLGEDFDPAMLASHKMAELAVPERKKWHAQTRKRVHTGKVGSWVAKLTPEELALCEWAMGDRLTAYGYAPSGAPTPPATVRLAYRRKDAQRRFAVRRRRLGDRMRTPLLDPVGRFLRRGERLYLG